MGGIDIRCWFELLEQRVLCSATSNALLSPPLTIDPTVPNVVLPSPLTGTQLPQSSTTVIQNTGANIGGGGPFAIGQNGAIWSTYGTSLVRTDSSGNSTVFQDPNGYSIYGLTVDSNGNAWAIVNSSTSNSALPGMIARIDTSGNFTFFTIPADQTAPDSAGGATYVPISIVASADGNVYVQLINGAQGNKLTQVAPDGSMNSIALPSVNENLGLVATSDGAIWFCGSEGAGLPDYIGRFTADGGVQQFVFPIQQAYEPPGPLRPFIQPGFSGLTPGANGSLWFANFMGGVVGNIAPEGTITEYQTTFPEPYDISQMTIAMAQDGSLWMSDAGTLMNMSVQGATPTFTTASNIAAGTLVSAPDGDIYMGNPNGPIGKLEFNVPPPPVIPPPPGPVTWPIIGNVIPGPTTTTVQTIGQWTDGNNPGASGIVVARDGTVWATDGTSELIRTTPDGTSTIFDDPDGLSISGLTIGGDGNIWITDTDTTGAQTAGHVARVTPDGQFTVFTIPSDGSGSNQTGNTAYAPLGIVTGADGAVWFEFNDATPDHNLVRVAPDGSMTFVALPAGSIPGPLAATSDGAIWFVAAQYPGWPDQVDRMAPDGSIQEFALPLLPGGMGPQSIQPGPAEIIPGPNGSVWFANNVDGVVGNITAQGIITEYQEYSPYSAVGTINIALAPDGSLWIADGGEAISMTIADNVPSFRIIFSHLGIDAMTTAPNGQVEFIGMQSDGSYTVGQLTPSTAAVPVPAPPPVTPPPGDGVIHHGPAGIPQGPDANNDTTPVTSNDVAAVAPPPVISSVFSHAPAIASHVEVDPFSVLPIDSNSLLN